MVNEKFKDALSKLNNNKTLYVLKGLNNIVNLLDESKFLFSNFINKDEIDVSKLTIKLTSGSSYFALYEDLIKLENLSLLGIISGLGYNIKLVDNDFFKNYYPGFSNNFYDVNEMYYDFESQKDNIVQLYYSDFEIFNKESFIVYGELEFEDYEKINISTLIDDKILNNYSEIIDDNDATFKLSYKLLNTIEENKGIIEISKNFNKGKINEKAFKRIGIELKELKEVENNKVDINNLQDYQEILKRKNKNFKFKDLKIYRDPYLNADLVKINQDEIIDQIVSNALKAQENKNYRDIFVTAPTGAGKSIMFQVPAIYLAEKYDLVTIIISPLIGLMNDQVDNIKKLTHKAATINSDFTPFEKSEILEQMKNGEKSILYLSPESLLSNSDITSLIGDRKIGMVVVDEAHIVATWGKSFRPDYWYLGDFINRLRRNPKNDQNFPIATFTATATFGGDEDMYQDIVDSLRMTPVKYIGNVKRNDISFDIRVREAQLAYQEEKLETAVNEIQKLEQKNEKTLVYVPYKKHIDQILSKVKIDKEKYGRYQGGLQGENTEVIRKFKNGDINTVIATKAFGMGIDIDDIKNVYHFAPTGNIADYVQEIGRAARKPGMNGVASTDFYKEDFRYINQLFGMSSIKNFQIISVLRKIDQLYRKYKERNFLISPDEFGYIFSESSVDDVDSKLKTTMLMIQKDFDADPSISYIPLIFKPRSMFTKGYMMVNDDFVDQLKKWGVFKYFKKLNYPKKMEENSDYSNPVYIYEPGYTYEVNLKGIWEDKFNDLSFGKFKWEFNENKLKNYNFRVNEKCNNRIIIDISTGEYKFIDLERKSINILESVIDVFDDLKQNGKYFSTRELSEIFKKNGIGEKDYQRDNLSQSIIPILNRIKNNGPFNRKTANYNYKTEMYTFDSNTYEHKIKLLEKRIRYLLKDHMKNRKIIYGSKIDDINVLAAQFFQILELANVDIKGGENPEYFIRVNSPMAIRNIINNSNYNSRTLNNVKKRQVKSVKLMEEFFTKLKTNDERWNFIEQYFLGKI